jgi:hypothetical protein
VTKRVRIADPVEPANPVQRVEIWRGMRPHDEIRVRGKPGQRRRYEFLAFIVNDGTGESYIEVIGGRVGRDGSVQRNLRVFPPERCVPPPRRRRRVDPDRSGTQLSFADLGATEVDGR